MREQFLAGTNLLVSLSIERNALCNWCSDYFRIISYSIVYFCFFDTFKCMYSLTLKMLRGEVSLTPPYGFVKLRFLERG